jgi:hypothetical protein
VSIRLKEPAMGLKIDISSLSVIGLSKNAGKTTVLNALIRDAPKAGVLGILSMGVDGEKHDAISGREKPLIRVRENMLVATSAHWLNRQPGHWEVIQSCGIQSVMGEVFIARAKREGPVLLAGLPSKSGAERAMEFLRQAGAQKILLDGAYDRRSPSSPQLTDATILVIGASLDPNFAEVLRKAGEWSRLLRLKACSHFPEQKAGALALEKKRVVGVLRNRIELLPFTGLFSVREDGEWLQKEWQALAISGALTDRMLQTFLRSRRAVRIIVPDITHLFVSMPVLRRFYKQGGEIRVLKPIRLLQVAVNPESPDGYSFPPGEMKEKIGRLFFPVPVVDVMRDRHEQGVWCDVL